MRNDTRGILAALAIVMLATPGCSKRQEGESMQDVGGGGSAGDTGDSFSSFQGRIRERDDAPQAAPAPPMEMSPPSASAPMRTTTETSETSVAGIVRTRRTRTTSVPVAQPIPMPMPIIEPPLPPVERRPQPSVQSGLLTAGDYDDLLNPRAYADYAGGFLQHQGKGLPFVDTRSRISIRMRDAQGRAVPFAKAVINRSGSPLRLTSGADGVVSFYPAFDKVSGRTGVTITSSAGGAVREVDVSRGPQNLVVTLPGQAKTVQALDVALVIDTTGSMGDEIEYLQAELDSIVTRIRRSAGNVDIRIGIVAYKDVGDEYVVRSSPMTGGSEARTILAGLEASGGGDSPEAMDQAMVAATRMQWRSDAVKAVVLVGDAPPHSENVGHTLDAVQTLRARGVQIVPVAASGVEDTAEYVMRTMSALTHGRYVFLTDDSGVGNAHAEPSISCYRVTPMNGLVARILAGFVAGRRIEARPEDVVREVGTYRRGRCAGEDEQARLELRARANDPFSS